MRNGRIDRDVVGEIRSANQLPWHVDEGRGLHQHLPSGLEILVVGRVELRVVIPDEQHGCVPAVREVPEALLLTLACENGADLLRIAVNLVPVLRVEFQQMLKASPDEIISRGEALVLRSDNRQVDGYFIIPRR